VRLYNTLYYMYCEEVNVVALHYRNNDKFTFGSKCVTRSQMDYFGKGLWVHSWVRVPKQEKKT
jgi:hypothetical protein